MIRNRLSLSCHVTEDQKSVEVSVHSMNADRPGEPHKVGRFMVDLAGWETLKTTVQLLAPGGGLSFTGDSSVDGAARKHRRTT
jgi:hypothetical protein